MRKYALNGVLFLIFLISTLLLGGWSFFRLFLVFSLIFLFPGYLLYKIIFPRRSISFFELLPLSYCLGFGVLVIPGTIAYFFYPDLNTFAFFYLIFILALFVLFLRYRKKIINETEISDHEKCASSNLFLKLLIGIIVIGSFVLMSRMGSHYGGDAFTHLGNVRHFFISGINPHDFVTGDGIRVIYGFNLWHISLALLSKLSFLEPTVTWFYLAALFTPLSLLAFYSLAKVLINNEEAASVALIVHVLLKLGGEGYERFIETQVGWLSLGQWTTLTYPYAHTLYVFIPMALFLIWHFLYYQKKNLIWAIGLLVLAIPAIHPLGLFSLFWAIFCFIIFSWIFDGTKEIKKFKRLIWSLIVIPAPYILLKALLYFQYRFSLDTTLNQVLSQAVKKDLSSFLIKVSGLFSFLDLNSFLSVPKIAFAVSLGLVFLLIFIKTHLGAKFLFSNILLTLAVRLNSVLNPFLVRTISLNLTVRTATRWLFYLGGLSIGWFFYEIFSFIRRLIISKLRLFEKYQKVIGQVFLFLMIIFLICGVVFLDFFTFMGITSAQTQNTLTSSLKSKRHVNPLMNKFLKFISENIQPANIFLVDTENKKFMQKKIAYTGNYAVSSHPRLGSAFMKVPPAQRIQDVEKILSPEIPFEESVPLLNKYGINYLLISQGKEELLKKFIQKLEKIFENEEVVLFKYK